MKRIKNDIYNWLVGMKADNTEHYKMCNHAYQIDLLDATSLAYDLFHMLGQEVTEQIKQKRKETMDAYQIGGDGFFYENGAQTLLESSGIERAAEMHGNYLTFQVMGAYKAIQKYPKKEISFYDKYISDIEKYLTINCPWDRSPWGAGGMVDNLGTILKCNIDMGRKKYSKTVDEIIDWLNRNQDEETGLWLNRKNQQGINGLVNGGYHLMRGTFFLYNRPFNMPERIIDTIIEDIRTNENFCDNKAHGCNDLDHFFLLQKCHELVPMYRREEVVSIAKHRKETILSLVKCNDGGFSFWGDAAVKTHNYIEVSPGMKESDMQGTVFYLQTLISINKILDEDNEGLKVSLTHG